MLQRTEQDSWKYRIAQFNKELHEAAICPANHAVEYANGWYYFDGGPERRPTTTRRAREAEADEGRRVVFNPGWNTYVLTDRW